jgi:co-chaperonin GroES (HSP10)
MILPVGHRVLVKQESYEETDAVFRSARKAGIVIEKDKSVRYQESVDIGEVVLVGSTAWKDFGSDAWAKVGDKVVFAKHAGKRVEDPENKESHFVVLNDEDIVAIIKG